MSNFIEVDWDEVQEAVDFRGCDSYKVLNDFLIDAKIAIEFYNSMQWQPIKTAPRKYGAEFLGHDGDYAFQIEWDGEYWCSVGGDEPTHWMPLPPMPEVLP